MCTIVGIGGTEATFLFLLTLFLLPVLALVDIVTSDFRGQNDKLIWVIVVIFVPVIGSLLYFLIGRNQRVA